MYVSCALLEPAEFFLPLHGSKSAIIHSCVFCQKAWAVCAEKPKGATFIYVSRPSSGAKDPAELWAIGLGARPNLL